MVDGMSVPIHLRYSMDHEWLAVAAGMSTIGITEFAVGSLGDIVYVQLPTVGSQLVAGQSCGEIESNKTVCDLHTPVSGEVIEVNEDIREEPSLINQDPYGLGWLFRMSVREFSKMLSATEYETLIR